MILVLIAWFLLLADLGMTYYAIKKYGINVESNMLMRALMQSNYVWVTALTLMYMTAIIVCYNQGIIDVWGWVVILGLNGSIFISNTIWFIKKRL